MSLPAFQRPETIGLLGEGKGTHGTVLVVPLH